jgi:hypothetical protein
VVFDGVVWHYVVLHGVLRSVMSDYVVLCYAARVSVKYLK